MLVMHTVLYCILLGIKLLLLLLPASHDLKRKRRTMRSEIGASNYAMLFHEIICILTEQNLL